MSLQGLRELSGYFKYVFSDGIFLLVTDVRLDVTAIASAASSSSSSCSCTKS